MSNFRFGDILKTARQEKGADLKAVSNETRIQVKYLQALETENFDEFLTEVQLKGFLGKYCDYLGLDFERVYALYRRDFGKNLTKLDTQVNPHHKLTLPRKYWLPIAGATLSILLIAVVILNLVSRSFTPPQLKLTSPLKISAPFEGVIVVSNELVVLEGNLEDVAVLRLNGEPLPTDSAGNFKTRELPLTDGENIFTLSATNSLNREAIIKLTITKAAKDDPEVVDMTEV